MKKLISILLIVLLIAAAAVMLTGCDKDSISVSSVMKIDTSFKGSRTVTVKYPLSADIDAIKDAIAAGDPTAEADGVTFTYKGVEEDGYRYELLFEFSDREEYEREVSAVIGREASSILSRKSSDLTRGVRMQENFGVDNLIAWIVAANETDSSTEDMELNYDVNTVTIGSDTYETGVTVDINEVDGTTVRSISINTINDKEGRYTRTFSFEFPNEDYSTDKAVIERYFRTVAPSAARSEWDPVNTVYWVQYQNLKLSDLVKNTASLLDTDSVSIRYEDIDDSSTPLSEGLTFEETLDVFSFVGPDKGAPMLHYTYSLPSQTSFGSGTILRDGRWSTVGSWEDGKYHVDINTGAAHLRVTDGIQYRIDGVDFHLDSLGSERFRRTTDFLYSKREGSDGAHYAVDYFTKKGVQATLNEDDDHLICSVICEGTTAELTAKLVELFGSGNFITYSKNSGPFSLATKSTFTDYVNLDSILNASNADQPLRYFISASGAENIVSVTLDGNEKAYVSAAESFVTLSGGSGTVEYYGSIPLTSHIVIYVIFGVLLLGATIFGAYLMMNYRRPGLSSGAQKIVEAVGLSDDGDDDTLAALTQTTTFSISELGILSRNKTYVDEINKDIEARIELDRLTQRKNEIRQKELRELEHKVYGSEQKPSEPAPAPASSLDEVPELDIDVLKAAVAQTSDASEADAPAASSPQPAEPPVNPFSLLDNDDDEV